MGKKKTIGIYGDDQDPRVRINVLWAKENGHIPRICNPKWFNPEAFRAFDLVIAIGDRSTEIQDAYKSAGVAVRDVSKLIQGGPKRNDGWAKQRPVVDNMWSGKRCFVVGGGESLKGFDPRMLAGENVIAINRAVETFPTSIAFSMDNRFWDWISSGQFGDKAKHAWMSHPRKVMVMTARCDYSPRALSLPHLENRSDMTDSIKDGLGHGMNSGFGALNLALCLGADPVYLLGFDMHGDGKGRQAHFHDGYPANEVESRYADFRHHFGESAKSAKAKARIINLNPDSAMECFEKATVDSVKFPDRPMYASYHTPEYDEEARGLIESLDKHFLEHDVMALPSLGNWEENCGQKAIAIAAMLAKYPDRKIAWLDADARVMKYPRLFDTCEADFAAFWLDGHELISASMLFARGRASRRLIRKWIAAMKKTPRAWDQRTLQETLGHWRGTRERLPVEYGSIFDHPRRAQDPVILQGQASRNLKGTIGA